MKYIFNTEEFRLENSAVCLGKFDGIHMGHRLLIDKIQTYKEQGLQSVVFTFALHPSTLFSNGDAKLIDTMSEKVNKLEQLGVHTLVSYPFTKHTASMEPEQFIDNVLVKKIDAKVIVVGNDFHFGHQRKGNVSLLRKYADKFGYEVVSLEKLEEENQVVSSTRIRNEIKVGNMEKVTRLLTVPYAIVGEVIHGKQLGRTIGMPTINQQVEDNKIVPKHGVYVSKVYLPDGVYGGITNIGIKPTVSGEKQVGVETHIFDFEGDLYGKVLKTEILHFVRKEQKFDSVEALKKQMHKDMAFGKEYLSDDLNFPHTTR